MWTRSSTTSAPRRSRRSRLLGALAPLLLITACGDPKAAQAQQVVFDARNHVENALQAARQLESLANEARALANDARTLAASPYSHLGETSQTLRDIGDLAASAKGLSTDLRGLQADFERLYPATVEGLSPREALQKVRGRNIQARDTAQDLAHTAAELERLSRGRTGRLQGALGASQAAEGQTAAIQSSTQVLAVLAEDLSSMRTVLLAQSRLLAAEAARRSADRTAATEARRRFWGGGSGEIPNPQFDPFPNARR